MTMRDLHNQIVPKQSIAPKVITATTNGTGVDMRDFHSAVVIVDLGIEGETLSAAKKYTFTVQGSDDDSTYTALTAAMMIGVSANSLVIDANSELPAVYQMGFRTTDYRYYRAVCTVTGSISTGTPMTCIIVKGTPGRGPGGATTGP